MKSDTKDFFNQKYKKKMFIGQQQKKKKLKVSDCYEISEEEENGVKYLWVAFLEWCELLLCHKTSSTSRQMCQRDQNHMFTSGDDS